MADDKGPCEVCPWIYCHKDKMPRVVPKCRSRAKPCVGTMIRRKELKKEEDL